MSNSTAMFVTDSLHNR